MAADSATDTLSRKRRVCPQPTPHHSSCQGSESQAQAIIGRLADGEFGQGWLCRRTQSTERRNAAAFGAENRRLRRAGLTQGVGELLAVGAVSDIAIDQGGPNHLRMESTRGSPAKGACRQSLRG